MAAFGLLVSACGAGNPGTGDGDKGSTGGAGGGA
jgi:hypothetical protein